MIEPLVLKAWALMAVPVIIVVAVVCAWPKGNRLLYAALLAVALVGSHAGIEQILGNPRPAVWQWESGEYVVHGLYIGPEGWFGVLVALDGGTPVYLKISMPKGGRELKIGAILGAQEKARRRGVPLLMSRGAKGEYLFYPTPPSPMPAKRR